MKKYKMAYRQRVYYCKACDLNIEHLGKGPLGTCHCCGVALKNLPKVLDNMVEVRRTVTPLKSNEE